MTLWVKLWVEQRVSFHSTQLVQQIDKHCQGQVKGFLKISGELLLKKMTSDSHLQMHPQADFVNWTKKLSWQNLNYDEWISKKIYIYHIYINQVCVGRFYKSHWLNCVWWPPFILLSVVVHNWAVSGWRGWLKGLIAASNQMEEIKPQASSP